MRFRLFSFVLFMPFVVNAFAADPLRCTQATGNALRTNYYNRGEWLTHPIFSFAVRPTEEPAGVPWENQVELACQQSPWVAIYASPGCREPGQVTDRPRDRHECSWWTAGELLPFIAGTKVPKFEDPQVRAKLIAIMRAELETRPDCVDGVYVDNLGHPSYSWMEGADGKPQISFASVCALLAGLRDPRWEVVANIAMNPAAITDEDLQMLLDSTDGISVEIGIPPTARSDPAKLRRVIAVYQRLLAAGKIVVLMGINKTLTDAADLEAELRYTAALGVMMKEPGQRLWVAATYYKPAPDWQTWPEQLGDPLGSLIVLYDGTVVREFSGNGDGKPIWVIAKPPRTVELIKQ